jgi:hypothetical protein
MRKAKILMQGDGIEICLGQLEAIAKIKNMNTSRVHLLAPLTP